MTRSEFLREVKRRGWRAELTGGNHFKVTHPSGVWRICPYSPRSEHSFTNLFKEVERAVWLAETRERA